jgi:hypothetical protein
MEIETTPQVVQFFLVQSTSGYIALKKDELRRWHRTVAVVGSHNGTLTPVQQYTQRRYGTDRVYRPSKVDHA